MILCQHEPRCARLDLTYCWPENYVKHCAADADLRRLAALPDNPDMVYRGLTARIAEHLGYREQTGTSASD